MNNKLKIAIIGDPNKGKSSFVSTFAYNDGIAVSSKSGETIKSSCHPLKIKDETVYELYDTPGFNNDEELLEYINENETKFLNVYQLITNFIEEYKESYDFSKDIEILKVLKEKPIVVYIVNSSTKYNSNFDCSLEIIKKFNLPSFIIYNQHDENKNEKVSWEDIEKKYFTSSFDYNVLNSNFNNKINFLEMLEKNIQDKTIKEQLCKSIKILNKDFERRLDFTYEELSDRFYKIINHTKTYRESDLWENSIEEKEAEFISEMKSQEKSFYSLIEKEWGFNNLEKEIIELKEIEIDAKFSEKILGASKNILTVMGIIIGASIGGGIGLSVDTASFFGSMGMGTAIGTIGGASSGLISILLGTNLIKKKTKGFGIKKITTLELLKLNTKILILTKMYLFVELLSVRSHAKRDKLKFNFQESKNLFDNLFEEKYHIDIARIICEKNKEKFIEKLTEILIDNYKERNNINFKESKCN